MSWEQWAMHLQAEGSVLLAVDVSVLDDVERPLRGSSARCPADRRAIRRHERCDGCEILIGARHVEPRTFPYRGRRLCAACIDWLQRAADRRLRAG